MEKISLDKFKDKQIHTSIVRVIGGNGEASFWDNLADALTSSEVVHPNNHTPGTGDGGCGTNHADGCHHHTIDPGDGTIQTYIGCGDSEARCSVGNH